MLTKKQIRSKILLKLRNQKEDIRKRKSIIIKEKLFRRLDFKKAKTVMFYLSLKEEVDTQEMIKAAIKQGKIVAIPVADKITDTIIPCRIGLRSKLKTGLYGILEPIRKYRIPLHKIDLVLVPGIAFDRKGNRLGRGKGYYDRFLRLLPRSTARIGLAFNFQILPPLPVQSHDCCVTATISA